MNPWLFLVLLVPMALTTYRLTRLVVEDTFPPVLWLRDRLVGGWRPLTSKESERHPLPVMEEGQSATTAWLGSLTVIDGEMNRYVARARWVPHWLADLLSCPFCASGWIGMVVVVATWFAPTGASIPVLCWVSVWALGGIIAAQDWA
jgi:RNA polymerase subunit RPABC4/transcription elongation factor Spt4